MCFVMLGMIFVVRFNAKDKIKGLILLLNKIRFDKKIKYLVVG